MKNLALIISYKISEKIRLKYETSLLRKNMQLKQELKRIKRELEETKQQNHKLIDQKTLDNIRIRELTLEVRK